MTLHEGLSCISLSIKLYSNVLPPIPSSRNLRIMERRFINIGAVGHCKVQRSMKHYERYPRWSTVVAAFRKLSIVLWLVYKPATLDCAVICLRLLYCSLSLMKVSPRFEVYPLF